jgi:hypothetical protein
MKLAAEAAASCKAQFDEDSASLEVRKGEARTLDLPHRNLCQAN